MQNGATRTRFPPTPSALVYGVRLRNAQHHPSQHGTSIQLFQSSRVGSHFDIPTEFPTILLFHWLASVRNRLRLKPLEVEAQTRLALLKKRSAPR